MREHRITILEIGLIAATRGMLGVGIGLLASERLRTSNRRTLGWTLFTIGAVSTIPLVVSQVMRARAIRGANATAED